MGREKVEKERGGRGEEFRPAAGHWTAFRASCWRGGEDLTDGAALVRWQRQQGGWLRRWSDEWLGQKQG
ncbi:hypothetical protein PVK06_000570 [Gossypium arboreum]|uniref:Uncharacterized protein n=1 Tax=Gossypium arboreum TaxID=29729 RepID=A0ABR0QZN9_GOSAR|nr:hypothetical protein PVK06_000570 [Gossypium arboreum]